MFSADEIRLLDRLALAPRGIAPTSAGMGRHRAHVRGHGLDFHDFRAYQPGDDPRSIDWTVHARLGHLVVRTTRADAHLRLHLLVDISPSMRNWPSKTALARRLAGALAYIAVRHRDAVGIGTFDSRVRAFVPPRVGHGQLKRVFSCLDHPSQGEASNLNEALTGFGTIVRGPGLVVILSDFFDAAGTSDGVRFLLHRGLQPVLVQLADNEECDPDFEAPEIELFDVERPDAPPILVGPEALSGYRERFDRWSASLAAFCRDAGIPWLQLTTSTPFDAVLAACERARLVVADV